VGRAWQRRAVYMVANTKQREEMQKDTRERYSTDDMTPVNYLLN
jgi:hypothetical protein